jgi:hypothetical protein
MMTMQAKLMTMCHDQPDEIRDLVLKTKRRKVREQIDARQRMARETSKTGHRWSWWMRGLKLSQPQTTKKKQKMELNRCLGHSDDV